MHTHPLYILSAVSLVLQGRALMRYLRKGILLSVLSFTGLCEYIYSQLTPCWGCVTSLVLFAFKKALSKNDNYLNWRQNWNRAWSFECISLFKTILVCTPFIFVFDCKKDECGPSSNDPIRFQHRLLKLLEEHMGRYGLPDDSRALLSSKPIRTTSSLIAL